MGRLVTDQSQQPVLQGGACLSRTASSPSPSSELTIFSTATLWPQATALAMPKVLKQPDQTSFLNPKPTATTPTGHVAADNSNSAKNNSKTFENLDLKLSTTASNTIDLISSSPKGGENRTTHLQLSIGSSEYVEKNESNSDNKNSPIKETSCNNNITTVHHNQADNPSVRIILEQARDQMKVAMAEKAYAEEARKQAKRQIELAEQEFANAKRIRQQAQAELEKACALKEHSVKQMNFTLVQITCHSCKQQFQARAMKEERSLLPSYMWSAARKEDAEVENSTTTRKNHGKTVIIT